MASPAHLEQDAADQQLDSGAPATNAIPISGGVGLWNAGVEQAAPACTIIDLTAVPSTCYGGGALQFTATFTSATGGLVPATDTLALGASYVAVYNVRAGVAQQVGLTFPSGAPASCASQLTITSNPAPLSGFPVLTSSGGTTRSNAGGAWGGTGIPLASDGQQLTSAKIAAGNQPCHSIVAFKTVGPASTIPSTGLHLWLRADAGIVPGSGAQIARWLDQSGNGRNASMATTARQPSLVSGALNGQPVVRFFGAQSMYLDVVAAPTTFSVFIVGKNSLQSESFSMILGPGGNSPNHQLRWESGTQALFVAQNAGTIITSTIGNTRVYHALSARYDGSTISFFRDGNSTSSGSFTNSIPWTIASVGSYYSSEFMTGDLAEVIIYDHALTETERLSVNAYLRGKYNLP